MRGRALWLAGIGAVAGIVCSHACPGAPAADTDPCTRPAIGSEVPEPEDLRSRDGVLKLRLTVSNHRESDGSTRYCYLLGDEAQAPTLRLKPGDTLVLTLKNQLSDLAAATPHSQGAVHDHHVHDHMHDTVSSRGDPCTSGAMSLISTNLHFHGLTVPPVCHQ